MNHRLLAAVAAAFAALGAMAHAPLPSSAANRSVPHAPAAKPIDLTQRRPLLGSGQFYTIHSVGAPFRRPYYTRQPIAFNNAGQIIGPAYGPGERYQHCVLWTGTAFVNLDRSGSAAPCYPSGISEVDATSGDVTVVGYVYPQFSSQGVALSDLVTANGVTHTIRYAHDPSQLDGVNAAGIAIGTSYDGNFNGNNTIFVSDGKSFAPLQPQCRKTGPFCMGFTALSGTCPFGGCAINDAGAVLGYDDNSGYYMTYTVGSPASGTDLTSLNSNYGTAVAINNAGHVMYTLYDPSAQTTTVDLYDIASGTSTAVGTLSGSSCTYYQPISFSNADQMLGYTGSCSVSSDNVYWTWDPTNGLQVLNGEIPVTKKYRSVTPIGVNDNGQILVLLTTALHGYSFWGTLDPPAAASRAHRARVAAAHPALR